MNSGLMKWTGIESDISKSGELRDIILNKIQSMID